MIFGNNPALQKMGNIPYGEGNDHAEGMTVFSKEEVKLILSLLCMTLNLKDKQEGKNIVRADIFHVSSN